MCKYDFRISNCQDFVGKKIYSSLLQSYSFTKHDIQQDLIATYAWEIGADSAAKSDASFVLQ